MPNASSKRDFTTHFGFRPVDEEAKQGMVNDVFTGVAARYDLMNDLMSAGLHHAWKDTLIDKLHPVPSMRLLDLAGGTGDIAARFLRRGGGHVTISDINPDMLEQGKRKAIDAGLPADRIEWLVANAEALPLPGGRMDACTMAFGIRNVTHIDRVLGEACRILRPGGQFLCLEFSHPKNAVIEKLYEWYSFQVIPRMGKLVAGDGDPYQYLVESIRQFPDADTFARMMCDAGFSNVHYRPLSGGIVALHTGWKV